MGKGGSETICVKGLVFDFPRCCGRGCAVVGPGLILFVRDEACLFTDQRRCRMGKFTYIEYYMKDGEMNGRV